MKKLFLLLLALFPLSLMAQGLAVRSLNGASTNQSLINPTVEGYLRSSEGATKTNATLVGTVNGTLADATFRSLVISGGTNWNVSGLSTAFRLIGTNGVASLATGATNAIVGTGITNTSTINRTAAITAVAVVFTIKNNAGTVVYTSPSFTGTISFPLQPGGAVTAASGLSGVLLDW